MSDADDHGTKITALVLSTLYAFYRSLLTRCTQPPDPERHRLSAPRCPPPRGEEHIGDPFLFIMITPLYCLVPLDGGEGREERHVLNFATTAEYEAWRGQQSEETLRVYRCERNKGLGSVRDMAAILRDADRLTVPVVWSGRSEEAVRVMLMVGDQEAGPRRRGVITGTDPLVRQAQVEARAMRAEFPDRPFLTVAELLCLNLGEAYRNLVFSQLPHMHDGLKQTARSVLVAAAESRPGEVF